MFSGKRKNPVEAEAMDLQAVMQKFDRESNVRIWEGKAKKVSKNYRGKKKSPPETFFEK